MGIPKGSSGEGPMFYPRYISGCAIPFCVRYTVCIPHNTLQLNIAPQHSQYLCKRVFQALFVRVYVGGNGIPLLFPSTWWLPSLNPITWYNPTHHDPPLINPVILLLYPIIPPWFYHIIILHIYMCKYIHIYIHIYIYIYIHIYIYVCVLVYLSQSYPMKYSHQHGWF